MDKQSPPHLSRFRQGRPEHVADVAAVIGWMKDQANVPLWLVGTSRGTQSAAFAAIELASAARGPDGLVLTSTIVTDDSGRPVPQMPLSTLKIPVLVVHHENDGCRLCASRRAENGRALQCVAAKELIAITGGISVGNPCEAMAYHGFNGIEADVVDKIARWILR